MKSLSRLFFLLALPLIIVNGCASSDPYTPDTTTIVSFTDVHFSPFYDTTLFDQLVAGSADDWSTIFQSSADTDPATWGEESNYLLFTTAVAKVCEQAADSPFVVYTGDILAHDFNDTFYELYGSEDETALKAFIYKTISFFVSTVRSACGTIPVAFTLGNNDAYEGDYLIEPGGEFLADTSDLFYESLLMSKADASAFSSTYKAGGYYSTDLLDSNLTLINLNTILFSAWAATGAESASAQQISWLQSTLSQAWANGRSVWILMHIPPGANIFGSISSYMDDSGQLSDASTNWVAGYQASITAILAEYAGTIDVIFAGHTHMDEYRLSVEGSADSNGSVIVTPGITPLFGNNPGFKVLTVYSDTWQPIDYSSYYDSLLAGTHAFSEYYTFSTAYDFSGILDDAFATLVGEFDTDATKKTSYITYYYSGHDASNPITDINWPAYKCGIEKMDKDEYIECVNSY